MAEDNGGNPDNGSPSDAERTTPTSTGGIDSVALHQCVSFGGRRGKKAAKPWRGRLKSRSASYLQFIQRLPPGPTVFSALTLHDKKGYSPKDGSRNECRDRVAWVDLHGRLVNADSATSVMKLGGKLGEQEKFVWETLCPLQRVLVVAVAAAAASAAKEKNADEVLRLRRVIRERESDLVVMREELGNLFNQVDGQRSQLHIEQGEPRPSDSLDELIDLLSQVDIQQCQSDSEEPNPIFSKCFDEVGEFSTKVDLGGFESTLKESTSPAVNRQLNFSDVAKKISPIKEESPSSGGPGLELVEKMMMSNSWIESLDINLLLEEAAGQQDYRFGQESVNKNIVFEQNASVQSVSGPEEETIASSAEREDSRPNETSGNGARVAYDINKENGNVIEWLSETSSVIMDPFSPMPCEKQRGYRSEGADDCSKDWLRKSTAQEKSFSARARCASILLDVKKQVIALLDQAALNVLEALTFISEQARQLEGAETNAPTPQKPEEAWNKKYPASSIKESVLKASMRISTLQTAMVRLWETIGPEAMAALDISPSDFDDYLTNLQIAKILNDDACDLSAGSVSIDSWREWFRLGFDNPESSFLRKIQVSVEKEQVTHNEIQVSENVEQRSDWPPSGSIYPVRKSGLKNEQTSPANISARQKMEKLMSPLFQDKQDESIEKTTSLVTVADELAAEFEKHAAKVASLKKYVKACDLKRKQVERKLLEAWEQDSKNQVKSGNEIMELKRQVRLKETAYQQLISSRKALVSSKTKEIAELREDCRRHNITLQDMAAAAKATQASSEKRLAMLEEICRKKDNSIISLKHEIFELENKLQELQACQTPAQLRPMNLPPTERETTDTESTDDFFDNENSYKLFGDDCQLRSSYQSMCGSENRRTSWGSDLSAQEFHVIDTPWSSELTAGQDFNVIEEAAFNGRSLSIFQNVTSSQEFLRGSLRRLASTPGGGLDPNNNDDPDSRPDVNPHLEARKENNDCKGISNYRKELSKSATGIPTNTSMVTTRSRRRDDKLRASTGVLSAVGPNTPFKPRRSTAVSKEGSRSLSSLNTSLNGNKPKENATRARQKWL